MNKEDKPDGSAEVDALKERGKLQIAEEKKRNDFNFNELEVL
jgi:hypothetical protein